MAPCDKHRDVKDYANPTMTQTGPPDRFPMAVGAITATIVRPRIPVAVTPGIFDQVPGGCDVMSTKIAACSGGDRRGGQHRKNDEHQIHIFHQKIPSMKTGARKAGAETHKARRKKRGGRRPSIEPSAKASGGPKFVRRRYGERSRSFATDVRGGSAHESRLVFGLGRLSPAKLASADISSTGASLIALPALPTNSKKPAGNGLSRGWKRSPQGQGHGRLCAY